MKRAVSKTLQVRGKKEYGYVISYQDKNGVVLSGGIPTQEELDTMVVGEPVDVSSFYGMDESVSNDKDTIKAPIKVRSKLVRKRNKKVKRIRQF